MTPSLGPWTLEDELGRGAAGVVYRARRAGSDEPVALKVLPLPADPARFERELRITRALGTPEGFVPLLDAGSTPERVWVAMPLMSGGTLRARIEQGVLPLEQAIELGRALAAALAAAHARGIVHRDVKPENVLFDGEGRPFLADLGTAKHWTSESSRSRDLSRTGELRGTPLYLPPEQAVDAARVSPAADVYALGVTLHECLTGRPPFRGARLVELLALKAQGRHVPLGPARPDAPPWLVAAIEGALEPDPARRIPTGAALAAALSGPPIAPGRLAPRLAIGLALGALGLGAWVAVELARRPAAPAAPDPAGAFAEDLALLAGERVSVPRREAALARVVRAPGSDAALASALSAHPASPWLRRARLLRALSGDAPLSLSDLGGAAAALEPKELVRAGAHALARGTSDPLLPAALPPAWQTAPEAALLAALAELGAGQRTRAVAALARAPAHDAAARTLRAALEAVDQFDRDYLRAEVEGAALLERGDRIARTLGELPVTTPAVLEAVLDPLTALMRRYEVAPQAEDLLREPREAFCRALLPHHRVLPVSTLAAFEASSLRWRCDRREYGATVAELRSLDLLARVMAACVALRERDPLLSIHAEAALLPIELRFHAEGPDWAEPIVTHAEDVIARSSSSKPLLMAYEVAQSALWYHASTGGTRSLERCLAVGERAIAAARDVGDGMWLLAYERRRWIVLLQLGRLDQLERELLTASDEFPDFKAELRRRRGDHAGAVAAARAQLAHPDMGSDVIRLRVTLALALAASGDRDQARAELARLVEQNGVRDDGEGVGYELTLGRLRAAVESE